MREQSCRSTSCTNEVSKREQVRAESKPRKLAELRESRWARGEVLLSVSFRARAGSLLLCCRFGLASRHSSFLLLLFRCPLSSATPEEALQLFVFGNSEKRGCCTTARSKPHEEGVSERLFASRALRSLQQLKPPLLSSAMRMLGAGFWRRVKVLCASVAQGGDSESFLHSTRALLYCT